MRKKKAPIKILAVIVIGLIAVIWTVLAQIKYYWNVQGALYIYPGISICGVDVGSLSVDQAIAKVDAQGGDIVTSPVVISWQQHSFELSQQTLRGFAIAEMAQRAYTYGRMGGDFERYLSIKLMPVAKHELTPGINGDWPGLSDYLLEAAAEFEVAPQNAEITAVNLNAPQGSRIQIENDTSGHELDLEKTARNVAGAVCAGLSTADAVMYEESAGVTYDDIKRLDGEPVTASFAFEGQKIADYVGAMLYGGKYILMQPGQLLSVRDLIKYNSNLAYDKNYNLASLHLASLIFNCSVQAGLAITEHWGTDTMPQVMYAPGTEAVVNDSKDLVIENKLNTPIVLSIEGGMNDNIYRISCSIFREQNYQRAMLKSFCDTADEGAHAQVFRVWVDTDGTEIGRELIDEVDYR